MGVSGGTGWQRLFEGTRLQRVFDHEREKEENYFMLEDSDGFSGRTSEDLEAAWVNDLGVSWKTKDPEDM